MKKVLLLLVFCVASSPLAFAGADGPGCGVGRMVWKGEKGLPAHLMAYTTNGTFSQPSAITTETSECDTSGTVMLELEQKQFIHINMDNLSKDMAMGGGQYVETLASLMGCEGLNRQFAQMTQEKFEQLTGEGPMEETSLLINLKQAISEKPVLSAGCRAA
ncbi:MAG: DUF3015 domain-containing protein [Deltaproteobacteria bacterium]|nr:DUF3015 domain-containing protein [Deltaproteobacteria bacterium]